MSSEEFKASEQSLINAARGILTSSETAYFLMERCFKVHKSSVGWSAIFFLTWRTNANLNTATWNKNYFPSELDKWHTRLRCEQTLVLLFFFSKCFKNYNWLKLSSENSQIQLQERRKLDCATFSQITTISYSSNWGGEKEKGEIIYSNKASQRRWCLKSTRPYRAARRVLSSTTLEQTSADFSDVSWVLKGQHLTSHYVR